MNWKSCDNCLNDIGLCKRALPTVCINKGFALWEPIHCPKCGGALSEIREHKGEKYLHCYACHFEFEEANR